MIADSQNASKNRIQSSTHGQVSISREHLLWSTSQVLQQGRISREAHEASPNFVMLGCSHLFLCEQRNAQLADTPESGSNDTRGKNARSSLVNLGRGLLRPRAVRTAPEEDSPILLVARETSGALRRLIAGSHRPPRPSAIRLVYTGSLQTTERSTIVCSTTCLRIDGFVGAPAQGARRYRAHQA